MIACTAREQEIVASSKFISQIPLFKYIYDFFSFNLFVFFFLSFLFKKKSQKQNKKKDSQQEEHSILKLSTRHSNNNDNKFHEAAHERAQVEQHMKYN